MVTLQGPLPQSLQNMVRGDQPWSALDIKHKQVWLPQASQALDWASELRVTYAQRFDYCATALAVSDLTLIIDTWKGQTQVVAFTVSSSVSTSECQSTVPGGQK